MISARAIGLLSIPFLALAAPAAASITKPESVQVPPPPPGKAQVVFFRSGGFVGSAISCAVKDEGNKISSLPPQRFIIYLVEPGKHTYSTASSSAEGVSLSLKAGEVRYVQCTIKAGFWAGKASLDLATEEQFTSKLWKSVDPANVHSSSVLTDDQIKAANAAAANTTATPVASSNATPAAPAATNEPPPKNNDTAPQHR